MFDTTGFVDGEVVIHRATNEPHISYNLKNPQIEAMKKIEKAWYDIFDALHEAHGLDWKNDDNFTETPKRVAKMMVLERCVGVNSENKCKEILSKGFPKKYDGIVVGANPITAYSLCPHHFENVTYQVWMGYSPKEKVVGLSKMGRVIKLYAKQPILQEDYTANLANLFHDALDPLGVIVIVKGKHNCMVARGLEADPEQWVVTSSVTGVFLTEDTYKSEFLNLIKN